MTETMAGSATDTQLLISVRDVAEARLALHAGVSMLDVKEPLKGPLGAAEIGTCQQVLDLAADQALVSAAMGELLDYEFQALPDQLQLAKFGLSRCQDRDDWPHLWRQAIASFPKQVRPVAVIYGDHEQALAPRPAEVISVGRELGCAYVLVDTFDKSLGSLLEQWSWTEVKRIVEQVKSQDMHIVLAGSLSVSDIRRLLPLRPSVVAVRGAACGGDRSGSLNPHRIHELVDLVHHKRPKSYPQTAFMAS